MTTQEIETRFESLERGMRRWRRLATVLVVGLAVVGTVAATRQEEIPDVVKARRFVVVTKAGKAVVTLTAADDGGVVRLNNKAGKPVVALGVDADGGWVEVGNKAGKAVVGLTTDKDGGVVGVYNKVGVAVVGLTTGGNGNGAVLVNNKAGTLVWRAPPN